SLFSSALAHRVLLSFPTRRSSDLSCFRAADGASRQGEHRERGIDRSPHIVSSARVRPDEGGRPEHDQKFRRPVRKERRASQLGIDRKSTRLNSSHRTISYAVFCLK